MSPMGVRYWILEALDLGRFEDLMKQCIFWGVYGIHESYQSLSQFISLLGLFMFCDIYIYMPYIHCHPNKLHVLSKNIYFGRYTNYIDIVQEAYPRHPGEFAPEVWQFWIPKKHTLGGFRGLDLVFRAQASHPCKPTICGGICRILFCWVLVRSPPSSCTLQSFQARGAQLSPENQPWLINGTCRRKDMEHRV